MAARSAKTLLKWAVARPLKLKLIGAIATLAVVASITLITVTTIIAAVTAPVAAVDHAVAWLFGADDDSADDASSVGAQLQSCMTTSTSSVEDATATVPPGTAADLAHGWVLYSLAHPSTATASATPPATTSPRVNSRRATQTRSTPTSFDVFSRQWQRAATTATVPSSTGTPSTSTTAGDTYPMHDGIPDTLTTLDSSTSYTPYRIDGIVAVIDLASQRRITLSDDQRATLAEVTTESCLNSSATSTAPTTTPTTEGPS